MLLPPRPIDFTAQEGVVAASIGHHLHIISDWLRSFTPRACWARLCYTKPPIGIAGLKMVRRFISLNVLALRRSNRRRTSARVYWALSVVMHYATCHLIRTRN